MHVSFLHLSVENFEQRLHILATRTRTETEMKRSLQNVHNAKATFTRTATISSEKKDETRSCDADLH